LKGRSAGADGAPRPPVHTTPQEAPPKPGSRAAALAAAAADEENQGLLAGGDGKSSGSASGAEDNAPRSTLSPAGKAAAVRQRQPLSPGGRPGGAASAVPGGAPASTALAARGGGGGKSALGTLRLLLAQREVWAICLCQYCQSYGMYGLLTWLPTFFSDYYGVEVANLGGFTLLPYVVQVRPSIFGPV
jgi:hypothetical protein